MSAETMDYQMESPLIPAAVNFNRPSSPPPRQCPYAFQQQPQQQHPNLNFYTNPPHYRNQYFPQNGVSFMPSSTPFNQHPLIWTNSNYPLLPPPTPSSHINNPTQYSHFPEEAFGNSSSSRGPTDHHSIQNTQQSTLNTNMSENTGQISAQSRRSQANSHEMDPTTNQSDDSENEIPSEDGSDFSTAPQWNLDANDRAIGIELPPMMSSYERAAASSIQNISLAEASTSTSANILPPTLPRNDLSGPSRNREYGGIGRSRPPPAGASDLHVSAWTIEREMFARQEESLRRRQRMASDSMDEEVLMNHLRDDPVVEAYLNSQVPPLANEENMRMDDPARLDHAARRQRALREFVMGRHVSRRSGASKSALESLVKVPVHELEEDDRTCSICYNDYGVENPEGVVEYPLQLPKCKHHFGQICLKKWLDDKSTCPYCRDQLPSDSLRARRVADRQRREMHLARSTSMLASSSMARRPEATANEALSVSRDMSSRLMGTERMPQYEVNMIGSGINRQEPALPRHPAYHGFNPRTTPRRSRGRGGSNGRVPMQSEFALFNNMRTPANPNAQQTQVPMRMPGFMSAQPAHFPSNPAQYDAPPPFPGQSSFGGFNPYAESYTPTGNPSYSNAPTQHGDYRPYPRDPYPSHADFPAHGYGAGSGPDPFFQSRNTNANNWPSGYPIPTPRSNRNSTAEGIHAAEAAGERRMLMSLERDTSSGQPSVQRQSQSHSSQPAPGRPFNDPSFSGEPNRGGNADEAPRYHHENPPLQAVPGNSFDYPPQTPPGNPSAPPYPRSHHRERSYPPGDDGW